MIKFKTISALILLGLTTIAFAKEREYSITVNNKTPATFLLTTKTCNGGIIVDPPRKIPPAPETITFSVQSDAGVGCILRYDDQKGSILGIQIHNHQVTCNNQGGLFSYDCIFRNDILIIDRR